MITHNLVQGSPEWHAHRASFFNASDAPAMMGVSPYKTRSQLVREYATGIAEEIDARTEVIFNEGHRCEALARPLAEALIGEDLYPVVGTEGLLSASFDGLTLGETIAFEHKQLNAGLREVFGAENVTGDDLPMVYQVQLEQQCMVSKCERILFMATKWKGDELAEPARHCWYTPNPELAASIAAGWKQFEADVAAYVPPVRAEVVVAEPVQSLPAVTVQVTGEISIRDNFRAFEVALRDFLEHRLIREPKTDQDFADLDVQIKALKGAEAALDSAESQMLAQIQTVDEAKKTKELLAKLVRDNRLMAEKLLASEKERRSGEIVAVGVTGLREHINGLNKRLGQPFMPAHPVDFGAAIKGKKNLASMEEAVATALAQAKIATNEIADRIQVNMQVLVDAGDKAAFPDAATLVLKATDDLRAVVANRIAEAERKLEAQREAIRAEEAAKLKREQDAEAARLAAAAITTAAAPAVAAPAPAPTAMVGSPAAADPSRACAVDRVVSPAPKADARPPITTGTLCARLGDGITVTADYLRGLGFESVKVEGRTGVFWKDSDFPKICLVIANRLEEIAEGVPA